MLNREQNVEVSDGAQSATGYNGSIIAALQFITKNKNTKGVLTILFNYINQHYLDTD